MDKLEVGIGEQGFTFAVGDGQLVVLNSEQMMVWSRPEDRSDRGKNN